MGPQNTFCFSVTFTALNLSKSIPCSDNWYREAENTNRIWP